MALSSEKKNVEEQFEWQLMKNGETKVKKKKNLPEYLARVFIMSFKEACKDANLNWQLCWLLLTVNLLKLEDELRGKKQRAVWGFQNMQYILNFDGVF